VPQAAISLMSQGGIPVVGIAQGGAVSRLRFEHVWVEAFVDYVPSRGAVNRKAQHLGAVGCLVQAVPVLRKAWTSRPTSP